MHWLPLSLGTALAETGKNLASKAGLHTQHHLAVALWTRAVAALVAGAALAWQGLPAVQPGFWLALAISLPLNAFNLFLFMWALRRADVSLVTPLLAFSPMWLALGGPIFLGEALSPLGWLGVGLLVLGAYALNVQSRRGRWLDPFRQLVRHPGSRAFAAISFTSAGSAMADKAGVQASSPALWATSIYLGLTLLFACWAGWLGVWRVRNRRAAGLLALAGALGGAGLLMQTTALTTGYVAYVIAGKRMSNVFNVVAGHLLFREPNLRYRLLGAALMVVGLAVLVRAS